MSDNIKRIAVLGLGRVGSLAATLLHETGFDVVGFDARKLRRKHKFKVEQQSAATKTEAVKACKGFDAVLSCLPYHLNVGVAKAAHQLGIHYFDLTEDVPTTKAIQEKSKTSKGVMAPQCGLAPGIVGIIGAHLAEQFEQDRAFAISTKNATAAVRASEMLAKLGGLMVDRKDHRVLGQYHVIIEGLSK